MKSFEFIFKEAKALLNSKRALMFVGLCLVGVTVCLAGDYSAGRGAIEGVATGLKDYIPAVKKLLYAIAGIVALTGAISVYIKMNNEEQDVKKSIMLIVGACIFLIAAAEALPAFFGY